MKKTNEASKQTGLTKRTPSIMMRKDYYQLRELLIIIGCMNKIR